MFIKDPVLRINLTGIKQHKWMLLSDNTIQMKVELAEQNILREMEKRKKAEEEKKLMSYGIPAGLALPIIRETKQDANLMDEEEK